jgi:hypothetical protein
MAVTASIRGAISISSAATAVLGNVPTWAGAMDKVVSLTNGTGANQADLAYLAERTVNSASNDDIDISGVLTDAFGSTITAAELVAFGFVNQQLDGTANTTNLTPGGSSSGVPGFTSALWPISPGGIFVIASPGASGLATVTGSTGDIIRIANSSGATAKYILAILARSA